MRILQCNKPDRRSDDLYAFASLKLGDLELRGEQKAAFNAVAVSNTIPSLSNILLAAFVVHFVVKSEIDVFLLFVLFALVETIDDTVKFVYGHTQWAPDTRKRLWKSAVEILN